MLHFLKVKVAFQFHYNRLNGVEKIVDEKIRVKYVHPSNHPLIETMSFVVFTRGPFEVALRARLIRHSIASHWMK